MTNVKTAQGSALVHDTVWLKDGTWTYFGSFHGR